MKKLKIVIENYSWGYLSKEIVGKTDDDFNSFINKDMYDVFIENLEETYGTMDYYGMCVGEYYFNGYSLVDDDVTKDTFEKVFEEFCKFVEDNI